jgi:hypothetical protein
MNPIKCISIATPFALIAAAMLASSNASKQANGIAEGDSRGAVCGAPDTGAGSPQEMGPVAAIHAHLCGFHFYNGQMNRQVRADHYCSHLNEDVWQCVIYESDSRTARLVGVEYIISGKLFATLPADERKLWHSHRYEVMSGQLIAPGMSRAAERQLMAEFVTTYGKTWYLWQVDRGDRVPLGLPKLMMGFTGDGQAGPSMVSARDSEYGIDTANVKADRVGISTGKIVPGADAWQHEQAFQIGDALLAGLESKVPSAP